MIVIASYYLLFAVMGASASTLRSEVVVGGIFVAMAVAGFRGSLWLVVVALAAHGAMDLVHHRFIDNPGVPSWWPGWCAGYAEIGRAAWRGRGGPYGLVSGGALSIKKK